MREEGGLPACSSENGGLQGRALREAGERRRRGNGRARPGLLGGTGNRSSSGGGCGRSGLVASLGSAGLGETGQRRPPARYKDGGPSTGLAGGGWVDRQAGGGARGVGLPWTPSHHPSLGPKAACPTALPHTPQAWKGQVSLRGCFSTLSLGTPLQLPPPLGVRPGTPLHSPWAGI